MAKITKKISKPKNTKVSKAKENKAKAPTKVTKVTANKKKKSIAVKKAPKKITTKKTVVKKPVAKKKVQKKSKPVPEKQSIVEKLELEPISPIESIDSVAPIESIESDNETPVITIEEKSKINKLSFGEHFFSACALVVIGFMVLVVVYSSHINMVSAYDENISYGKITHPVAMQERQFNTNAGELSIEYEDYFEVNTVGPDKIKLQTKDRESASLTISLAENDTVTTLDWIKKYRPEYINANILESIPEISQRNGLMLETTTSSPSRVVLFTHDDYMIEVMLEYQNTTLRPKKYFSAFEQFVMLLKIT
ncbi:MAG: hypothetical protein Q8P90_03270 [bacterium]|nr:hypothetical protein [bacterium]